MLVFLQVFYCFTINRVKINHSFDQNLFLEFKIIYFRFGIYYVIVFDRISLETFPDRVFFSCIFLDFSNNNNNNKNKENSGGKK